MEHQPQRNKYIFGDLYALLHKKLHKILTRVPDVVSYMHVVPS